MSQKQRIEELERRVRELEARPISYPPVYLPYPVPAPNFTPYPMWPIYPPGTPWWLGQPTCGGTANPTAAPIYFQTTCVDGFKS